MNILSVILPVIFIIWVLLIAARVGAVMDKRLKKDVLKVEVPKKVCPLHAWEWLEQPGLDNTWYMKCNICGKTPRQVGESI